MSRYSSRISEDFFEVNTEGTAAGLTERGVVGVNVDAVPDHTRQQEPAPRLPKSAVVDDDAATFFGLG